MTADELLFALLGLDGRTIGDDEIKNLDASVVADVRARLNAARRRLRPDKPMRRGSGRGIGREFEERLYELVSRISQRLTRGVPPKTALRQSIALYRKDHPERDKYEARRMLKDYGLIPIDENRLRKFLIDFRFLPPASQQPRRQRSTK